MVIHNVKYSYFDRKYKLGPYIDFYAKLTVPSVDYNSIVSVIQKKNPEYEEVKLMSFDKG